MIEINFKDTEVGSIPEAWHVTFIKDISDIVTGATPSTSIPSYWNDGTIPWMSSGELNDKMIYDVKGRITQKGYDNSGTHMLPSHCVLIGLAGQGKTRGTAAYNHIELCTNQSIAAVLPNDEKFDSLYLYHYVDSIYYLLRQMSAGDGGRGGLNKQILLNLQVPLPSLQEQSRIASALSSIDNLISSLTKLIKKKQSIKIATMQQLLTGKKRLKGFTEPWAEKCIKDAFTIIGNNCFSRNEMSTSGIVRNVHYGDVLIKFGAIINADSDDLPYLINKEKAVHPLCDGDIIMADTAEDETCGKACEIRGIGESMVESGLHTIALRPREEYGANFLGYYMNSAAFHNLLLPLMQGTKVTSISKSALMEVRIKTPSDLAEQKAIADILTDMDKEITVLEQKLAKYESIKKGMMQELLTGKIRLV